MRNKFQRGSAIIEGLFALMVMLAFLMVVAKVWGLTLVRMWEVVGWPGQTG